MSLARSLTTTGIIGGAVGISTDGILAAGSMLTIASISPGVVGDDGGWIITATGAFPTSQGVLFRVRDGGSLDELCYSGLSGDGEYSTSLDGATVVFVVPPLPIGGSYDLYVETEDGALSYTKSAILTIIHRSFTDRLYGMRSGHPPPRDSGPYDVRDEV